MQGAYWQNAACCVFSASNQLVSYPRYSKPCSQRLGSFVTLYSCKGLIGKLRHIVYSTLYSCKGLIGKMRHIVYSRQGQVMPYSQWARWIRYTLFMQGSYWQIAAYCDKPYSQSARLICCNTLIDKKTAISWAFCHIREFIIFLKFQMLSTPLPTLGSSIEWSHKYEPPHK